jgi:uncharacterized membrane protein
MSIGTERSELDAAPASRRDERFAMIGIAIVGVWVAVGLASIFSPDMVTGAQQDHLPIAAMSIWLWGAITTGFIVMTGAMGHGVSDHRWRSLAITLVALWAVIAAAAVWTPVMVTGTDPTRIPLASLLAPIAGTIATGFICLFVTGTSKSWADSVGIR